LKFFANSYQTVTCQNISEKPLQKNSRMSLQNKTLQKTPRKFSAKVLKCIGIPHINYTGTGIVLTVF